MANNVQNVKFLRNGSLYATREAARAALETNKSLGLDGSAILARYGSGTDVKTLVGFIWNSGTTYTVTIFDIDGASADVEALRTEINNKLGTGVTSANTATAQFAALSGTAQDTSASTSVAGAKAYAKDYTDSVISTLDYNDAAVTGEYVSQVSEADGIIAVTRVALPDASSVSGESKVVVDVTQDKGQITASAANLTGVKLDGYTEASATGDVAPTDTLGQALGKLQKTIHEMDKAADAVAGQVVTTVSEADGVVSETKANVKDLQLGGYVKDTTATGDIASADTINAALSKLENKSNAITIANADGSINVTTATTGTDVNVNIKSGEKVLAKDGGNGLYTDLDFVKITSGLPETVKERYQILATDDSQIGVNLDIPKDSHIVSINYITTGEHAQNLEYVYIDVSGNTQTTYVDMSELVLETEFASGVTVTDGVAHGVVDPTSESYLTVGANGFKLSGVDNAISGAVQTLDASVTGGTTAGTATSNHVQVIVDEVDGVITGVTVSEANIADASALAQEITDRGDADTELSNRLGTGVTSANTATAQFAALSGNNESTSAETSVEGAKRYADAKLGDVVGGLDADVSGNSTHVTVGVEEVDGKITAVTVAEDNIASASDLTDEIAHRKAVDGVNGDAYTADTSATYISDATSLFNADQKLDAAIDGIADNYVSGVTVNGTAVTVANNVAPISVSGATSATTATSTEAITVETDANGNITLGIAIIDCGTY